jgi:TPR repeat protein
MFRTSLLALSAALALASPGFAQSVRAGIEAWQKADYTAAVAAWRPLAEAGDADAAFNLGQAYRLGRGVPLNIGAGQTWFERAARKGHVDAQTTLGLMLFENGNQEAGLRWLKLAAEQGEARALLIYGTALFNGDNLPRDPVLGYAYVSRAAAQGLVPAKQTLAQLDSILPVPERKKGVALAIAKARKSPPPSAKTPKAPTKIARARSVAAKPLPAAAAGGAWRIQLGAFSRRGAAEALFARLASGPLAGRQAHYVPVGAMTRLQVGPFASRAAAQAACSALAGQGCFPVPAR